MNHTYELYFQFSSSLQKRKYVFHTQGMLRGMKYIPLDLQGAYPRYEIHTSVFAVFCQVFRLQSSHKCPCSYATQIYDSNHHHTLMSFQQSVLSVNNCPSRPQNLQCQTVMETVQYERTVFQAHLCTEEKCPLLTKAFLKLSPETAMLFAPFRCTHQPSSHVPFHSSRTISQGHCQRYTHYK